MDTETLLGAITDEIVAKVHPERVMVFGSHARGDASDDSDLDLLVVVSDRLDVARSRRKQTGDLYRYLARFRVPKDILLVSREEFDRWRDAPGHVVSTCMREGRVLYELH